MNVTVGTTAVVLVTRNSQTPVVQNLGPGDLYLGYDNTVTTANGLKLESGAVYEFMHDTPHSLYGIASAANTDVRILVVG